MRIRACPIIAALFYDCEPIAQITLMHVIAHECITASSLSRRATQMISRLFWPFIMAALMPVATHNAYIFIFAFIADA